MDELREKAIKHIGSRNEHGLPARMPYAELIQEANRMESEGLCEGLCEW